MARDKREPLLLSRRQFLKFAGTTVAGLAAANVFSKSIDASGASLPQYTIEEAYQMSRPLTGSKSARQFVMDATITSRSMRIKKYYLDDNYGPKIREILQDDRKMDFANLDANIVQYKTLFDELRLYRRECYLSADFKNPGPLIIYPLEKNTIDRITAL